MIVGRRELAGAGSQTSAINFGGATPSFSQATELYTETLICTGTYQCYIKPGAWSSGGNMINSISTHQGDGAQNAALAFGGYSSPATVACTEEYDGSAWASGGAMINGRRVLGGSKAGTQDAAFAAGGRTSPIAPTANEVNLTEEYDGTTWSSGGNLITARSKTTGGGTVNAGLLMGGAPTSARQCTEEYDGSAWSAGGNLITGREELTGTGTQNAGLVFGGGAPGATTCTEEYDGSSWATGGALITARIDMAGAGTQNAALGIGGRTPTKDLTEEYDGTSWTTGGALATARYQFAAAGTQTTGLAFGGNPTTNVTEEYNQEYVFSNLTCCTRCLDATCTQL